MNKQKGNERSRPYRSGCTLRSSESGKIVESVPVSLLQIQNPRTISISNSRYQLYLPKKFIK
jgi:hypothetical protein